VPAVWVSFPRVSVAGGAFASTVEIAIGPYLVTGTITAWREMMQREQEDARPLSQIPELDESPWADERIPFPVTGIV
jgi:hypothetical protein